MRRFKVIFSALLILGSFSVSSDLLEQKVYAYQEALIRNGVTGSSIAGVFGKANTLVLSTKSSNLEGDRAVTEDTIFPIWSMSKPITIVAMMILLDEGAYKLDDPVRKYIPYFEALKCRSPDTAEGTYPCEKELLIEHLLTHRSGYAYYGGPLNNGGPDFRDSFLNLDEFVRHVASHPVEFEPGTEYLYGINQAILGRLIEVLSDQEFYIFLQEKIFNPLGMRDTKFFLTDAERARFQPLFRKKQSELGVNGIAPDGGISRISDNHDELDYREGTLKQLGGEGLVSTFRDYRRFCEMLLAGGSYKNKVIISPESFNLMTTIVTPSQVSAGYNSGFGYAFSMFSLEEPLLDGTGSPKGIFGWSGYHNTHFWIDQKNEIFGLFMSRTTPFSFEIQKHFRAVVYDHIK